MFGTLNRGRRGSCASVVPLVGFPVGSGCSARARHLVWSGIHCPSRVSFTFGFTWHLSGTIRTRRSMLPRRCDHPVCTNVSSDPPGIGGRPSGIRFGLPTDGHRVDTVLELVGTKALNHNHNHNHNGVQ